MSMLSCRLAPVTATASGSPAASHNRWYVEPRFPLSVGFGPVSARPPFARTLTESMHTRDQSSSPLRPSSPSTAGCRASHTPARCHSRSRRQQVQPEPNPSSAGTAAQPIPVVRTNRMPSRASRSSRRGRPPGPRGRDGGGISGSSRVHKRSSTSRRGGEEVRVDMAVHPATGAHPTGGNTPQHVLQRRLSPQIVRKRRRRLDGIDEIVLSLTARGLTTGEVAAHFAEVYGTRVSKDTISRITDKVLEEMTEWRNRPLDRVYPVIFIDAIVVKIRDRQVVNRPIYAVIGVTVHGERDILGLWAGDGSES